MTTLAHISDLHFGRLCAAAAETLVAELHTLRPDLLIVSGDVTQRARRGQFALAGEYLARLPGPQMIVPGNHDVPLWNLIRRFASPRGRFDEFVTPERFPYFENADVQVIGANTARPFAPRVAGFWKDGSIEAAQLREIAARFADDSDSASKRVRVLVAHHPFIEPPGGHRHGIVHGAAAALTVLEKAGVDLILGGHVHKSYRGDVRTQHPRISRPIINLMAGSATSTRLRDPCNAYNVVTIAGGAATIRVREFRHSAWVEASA